MELLFLVGNFVGVYLKHQMKEVKTKCLDQGVHVIFFKSKKSMCKKVFSW